MTSAVRFGTANEWQRRENWRLVRKLARELTSIAACALTKAGAPPIIGGIGSKQGSAGGPLKQQPPEDAALLAAIATLTQAEQAARVKTLAQQIERW